MTSLLLSHLLVPTSLVSSGWALQAENLEIESAELIS